MALDEDIALFQSVPTLAMLGPQALQILAIGAETLQVDSGAVLFYAGEPAIAGYVIQQGSIRLLPADKTDGNELTLGPGTLIGELALIAGNVRPATAIAQEPSIVVKISRAVFLKVLEGYPEAARALRDMLAARVERWTHELAPVHAALRDDGPTKS
jgi:CRP-like cAMP-binding protein